MRLQHALPHTSSPPPPCHPPKRPKTRASPLPLLPCRPFSQVLGGNGYTSDYPTGRLLRDAKLYEIGAGTSEIRRMLIGRELFQEAAAATGA